MDAQTMAGTAIRPRQDAASTSSINWWPYPAWSATTSGAMPPTMVISEAPTTTWWTPAPASTPLPTTSLAAPPLPITTQALAATSGTVFISLAQQTTIPTVSSLIPTSSPTDSASSLTYTSLLSSLAASTSDSSLTPTFASASGSDNIVYISALPPSTSRATPMSVPISHASLSRVVFKPIYLAPVLGALGVALGALAVWCACGRRRWRARSADDFRAGPAYAYDATKGDEDADELDPEKAVLDLAHDADADELDDADAEHGGLGGSPSKRARHGAPYASVASHTGRWLAGVFASQGRGHDSARSAGGGPARSAHPQWPTVAYLRRSGAAHAVPPPHDASEDAGEDLDAVLSPGGALRRARTAGAPPLLSSRALSSGDAEEISTDELALRLGLGLRAPARAAGSPTKKERDVARGADSALAAASTDNALWTPATGLRILREDPASGTLSRASSRAGGAGGGGWTLRGALQRGRSGLSLGLAPGADGDRFTTAPTRHARTRSAAGSPAGSRISASVYSAAPTPVPGPSRRTAARAGLGTDERASARRGTHRSARSDADTPGRATPRPARRGTGKSTRTVDTTFTVDTSVLPASPPLLTSLRLEESLAFGDLLTAGHARGTTRAHEVVDPPKAHAHRKLHLGAPGARSPSDTEGSVAAAHTPAGRYRARRAVHERVQHVVRDSWDARGPSGAPWSPTGFGALASPPLPAERSPGAASDSSAGAGADGGDGAHKPSKVGGIIQRLEAARRLDAEGAGRG